MTGVQTCALPIYDLKHAAVEEIEDERLKESDSDVDEVSDAEYALSDQKSVV